MIAGILKIIIGIWMTRWGNRFEAQWREEMFAQWELRRKITDDALRQIDASRKANVQILQDMADRIGYIEDRKESVLRDFKEMLYAKRNEKL